MEGPNGKFIQSTAEMLVRFTAELMPKLVDWQRRLTADPSQLATIEEEVQQACSRGAGMMVAALVSVVLQSKELVAAAEKTRQEYSIPLAKGRDRTMQVKLSGGSVMWVTSAYCEPKRGTSADSDEKPSGVHIALAQFGFGKKVSPGVESRIARQSALCPSFDSATKELNRDGMDLDVKTTRRVSLQCGDDLLKFRTWQLEQWRAGKLLSSNELAGKRVTVQIDGGRTKIRGKLRKADRREEEFSEDGLVISDAPGRSKAVARRTFDAEWREPKLMTIFIHDDTGRMVKKTRATIDGTFTGHDAMSEIVAMHLHRLGAAKAQSICFVSDGAVWIWDRIRSIVKQAAIPDSVRIHEVLDNCHAVHQVSMALSALGIADEDRNPLYRELRTRLRNGQWRSVVDELESLARENPECPRIQTEVSYLQHHGEAGRLAYPTFRGYGLPLGSGAIESSIRRVINLRLKGNGIFWEEENAEVMLQIRALVISDRWDERVAAMRSHKRRHQLRTWHWAPREMSCKSERGNQTADSPA
ncbi:MAG: hypothetical protein ACKON9_00550 [Planctomycetaceae bacterium]